jgi:hypothetical protein
MPLRDLKCPNYYIYFNISPTMDTGQDRDWKLEERRSQNCAVEISNTFICPGELHPSGAFLKFWTEALKADVQNRRGFITRVQHVAYKT